ncbi:unnamed protein product [Pleuronectes platessa]|uniref:Uncharacterized protein n=1 Tax=Pleuronectes platessa TaxID=8262 RepID=A0A9N7U124_PLEPL|nr:unnamed protein product [Pleuronectes platessa]
MWCRLNNEALGDHAHLLRHLFIPPSLHPSNSFSPPPLFPSVLAVSGARFYDGFSKTQGEAVESCQHASFLPSTTLTHTQTHLSRRLCSLGQLPPPSSPGMFSSSSGTLCRGPGGTVGGGFPGLATVQSTHTSWESATTARRDGGAHILLKGLLCRMGMYGLGRGRQEEADGDREGDRLKPLGQEDGLLRLPVSGDKTEETWQDTGHRTQDTGHRTHHSSDSGRPACFS